MSRGNPGGAPVCGSTVGLHPKSSFKSPAGGLLFKRTSCNVRSRAAGMYVFGEQRLTTDERFVLCKDMPMSLSKQLQVFLLHARQDEESVRRLYSRLLKEGADVWLDQEKLLPGQDWVYEIRKALESSDIVIACLSRQFNKQGGFRHEELRIALEKAASLPQGSTFLIPARLEKCELPEPLRRWQCVDLFETNGYKKLIRVLKE